MVVGGWLQQPNENDVMHTSQVRHLVRNEIVTEDASTLLHDVIA